MNIQNKGDIVEDRLEVLKKELQQINQNIIEFKAAAYDRIAEIEMLIGKNKTEEKKEGK